MSVLRRTVIDAREVREVQRNIEAAGKDFGAALRGALYEIGWMVADASQEIVPVRYGVLKASMDVSRPTEEKPEVWITYGGPAVAYALYQHEGQRSDGSHVVRNYSEPGKSKHYLTIPLEEVRAELPGLLVDMIKKHVR